MIDFLQPDLDQWNIKQDLLDEELTEVYSKCNCCGCDIEFEEVYCDDDCKNAYELQTKNEKDMEEFIKDYLSVITVLNYRLKKKNEKLKKQDLDEGCFDLNLFIVYWLSDLLNNHILSESLSDFYVSNSDIFTNDSILGNDIKKMVQEYELKFKITKRCA